MQILVVALVVIAAVAVFAIAAAVVGREAHRLDAVAPRAVYDLEEAAAFVADRLSPDAQARLRPDELRTLLRLHMRRLHDKGLQPDAVVDREQDIADPVVIEETTDTGWLIGQAERAGLDVEDVDVALVIDAHLAYFDSIGAVGPEADDPELPQ